MADLAKLGGRTTAQGRITNNRDAILPTRRLDQAPDLRNREDMRNASRGSGEVDAVRRTLGLAEDALGTYADRRTKEEAVQAREDAGQGRADAAMGTVDEKKAKASLAYSTAISMTRARRKAAEIELILKPEIEDLLSKGADADPTKGEQPVDLEDVNELIESRFRSLVLDEDGKPIDFGDPAANMEVYSALEKMRPELLARSQEIIRAQEAEKVIRGFGDELETAVLRDGTVDVEGFMGRLPPGVDRNKARAALLDSVVNAAMQAEDPDVLLSAANSRRPDGTPTWTPQQEGRLRDEAQRVEALADRKLQETSQETLGTLSVQVRSGRKLDPSQVSELIAQKKLRPQDAELAFAIQERVEDERWEDVQRARSNISWNQSQVDRARRLRDERTETVGAQAGSAMLRAKMAAGDVSPGRALQEASQLFAAGSISLKTFEFLSDEAKKIPTNDKAVKTAGAASYETELNRFVRMVDRARQDGKPGRASVDEFNLNAAKAKEAFYTALRRGEEPVNAYALAIGQFPGVQTSMIKPAATQVQNRASTRRDDD
jgi:hypothetical protein